jgi:hypothetical protein
MLSAATYEEVEADRSATRQALAIVVCSSVAAGIGTKGLQHDGPTALAFFASTSAIALIAWAIWAFVMFEIGTRLFPAAETRADLGELLRTLGFAATPGLIQVLGVIPGATAPVFTIAGLWTLAATVVAVRQALDYRSTSRAFVVCGLGWILSWTFAIVLGLVFGPTLSGFPVGMWIHF